MTDKTKIYVKSVNTKDGYEPVVCGNTRELADEAYEDWCKCMCPPEDYFNLNDTVVKVMFCWTCNE